MPDTLHNLSPAEAATVHARTGELLQVHLQGIWRRADRLFIRLLLVQWIVGVALTLWLSPLTWAGSSFSVHPHVWEALLLGGLLAAAPALFGRLIPGHGAARHVIAVAQMLSSALLIHLGGGRIEMHFHVFGSLAFLAFYRDWKVLVTASAVVAADHMLRGIFFPASVFGLATASHWRWLEHASWVIFEDIFLIASCTQGIRELRQISERQALLEHSHRTVEDKVEARTRELAELQEHLVKAARSAGMAEIATSVLHNVGNVLNSVNVSVAVATKAVKKSPVQNLEKAAAMIADHQGDLGQFLTQDAKGKQIPAFLTTVAKAFSTDQARLLDEMESLTRNIEHIKEIVHLQQTHGKVVGVIESVRVPALIDDAIRVALAGASGQNIRVVKEIAPMGPARLDKHILLQILVNLVGNARQALNTSDQPHKTITLRAEILNEPKPALKLQVIDNGVGIPAENVAKIFQHGFTTRKDGHGFGLHSAANAAAQFGGSLTVASDGPGAGAAFTLHLPLDTQTVTA